ncbi:Fur family transcriptional regulator [Acrocarpospora macrocephala]|uniref:Fur family transcriptional regulator n=1 Tax=Acrocarpospora macrocephala TaxID=150177 RepID=UPI0012D2B0E7|nr:Fur family transcriptional regulator [Acrocarpospora macrocephala]
MPEILRWHAQLSGAGVRATRKRVQVLEVLIAEPRPITARQLHAELLNRGEPIGLTTVYRAVSSLVDAGLVHAFTQAGEATYRVCGPTRHHHLICRSCGLVLEQTAEPRTDGFEVEAVYGVCAPCARRALPEQQRDQPHRPRP